MAGIIEHKYRIPSEQPGQYAAERCGRQAVTAKWLLGHPDATGYTFSAYAEDCGYDPWREIVGVDALCDGSKIILEFGRTGEKTVDPDFEVYVSRKALAA
jgi:hypothetical protein